MSAAQGGSKILVEGHRGARAVLPENTLPAFVYAIDAGADYIELDVATTQDDVLVVSHDLTLNAKICLDEAGKPASKPIRQMTLAEVKRFDCGHAVGKEFPRQQAKPGTRVPTLEEVFQLAKRGKFHFNVEIKMNPAKPELTPEPEVVTAAVLAMIRKHKLEKRVVVQSFDFRILHALAKLDSKISRAALWPSSVQTMNPDFLAVAKESQGTVLSPNLRLVTPEQVKAAHAAGYTVVPWTANTEAEWEKLVAAEVDAIITDDPAGLLAYLRQRGKH